MMILDQVRDFIRGFDRQEFIRWASAYVLFFVILVGAVIVYHVTAVNDIRTRTQALNKARSKVQDVLTQYQQVDVQKNKVVAALNQDKKFNIQIFFKDLGVKLPAAKSVVPKFARKKLGNGYEEESLTLDFVQIDTQQLCELLQNIESEPLVYVTYVDITRVSHAARFNASMLIATLTAEE